MQNFPQYAKKKEIFTYQETLYKIALHQKGSLSQRN